MLIEFDHGKANQHDHFLLLVFAQSDWKEELIDNMKTEIIEGFSSHNAECNTCDSCIICLSLTNLFDPFNPGKYNKSCSICINVATHFKDILGVNSGLILSSHYKYLIANIVEFISILVRDDKIKKIYLLQTPYDKQNRGRIEIYEERINLSTFKEKARKLENMENIIFEIYKDKYY